jgi:hypothetical protein
VVPARVWIAAIVIAVVTTIALWGTKHDESAFCASLRDVDDAVAALREAREVDDSASAPQRLDDIADAFDRAEPPTELEDDWPIIVERFHHIAEDARSLLRDEEPPPESAADADRFAAAWASFSTHAIDECGRTPGRPLLG